MRNRIIKEEIKTIILSGALESSEATAERVNIIDHRDNSNNKKVQTCGSDWQCMLSFSSEFLNFRRLMWSQLSLDLSFPEQMALTIVAIPTFLSMVEVYKSSDPYWYVLEERQTI